MRGLTTAAGLVLLVSASVGCETAEERDGLVTARVLYSVSYTVAPEAYDDGRAKAALRRCTDLPGARLDGQDDSMPPQPSVRFEGHPEDQERLEDCLRSLPNAKISSPHAIPSGVK